MRASGPQPLRLLIGSFLLLIAAGTALLMTPWATPPGQPIGWIDALFTATSATCVTGLIVRDTGTGFTLFGQLVILALIQLGALGIMTFSLFVLALFGRKVSLAQRTILEQTVGGVVGRHLGPLLRLIVLFTFVAEALGAILLFARWAPEMGLAEGFYAAVFHSISAFCNAGFSLWADSLTRWQGDPFLVAVFSAQIVLGGLGFFTLFDVTRSWRMRTRLSVHTKLALTVSAALIVLGAAVIGLLEGERLFSGMSPTEKLLAAVFQSVTTRTAGFNTVDVALLAPGTLFLMILLMFIGGSPGSTAGGIKTTTLGVLVISSVTRLRGHRYVNAFHRTLTAGTVRNTLSIAMGGIVVVIAAVFALLLLEAPGVTVQEERALFIDYFFETVSALGTVGLSTGVTGNLAPGSRLLVVLLMFFGRLGPLTVATSLASGRTVRDWQYPEEEVMVG